MADDTMEAKTAARSTTREQTLQVLQSSSAELLVAISSAGQDGVGEAILMLLRLEERLLSSRRSGRCRGREGGRVLRAGARLPYWSGQSAGLGEAGGRVGGV